MELKPLTCPSPARTPTPAIQTGYPEVTPENPLTLPHLTDIDIKRS
jgi:hypothetical protein